MRKKNETNLHNKSICAMEKKVYTRSRRKTGDRKLISHTYNKYVYYEQDFWFWLTGGKTSFFLQCILPLMRRTCRLIIPKCLLIRRCSIVYRKQYLCIGSIRIWCGFLLYLSSGKILLNFFYSYFIEFLNAIKVHIVFMHLCIRMFNFECLHSQYIN